MFTVRKKDACLFLFFIIFWILPITYTGLFNKDVPFLPRTVCYLQRVARLFTHSVESWLIFYIQIQPVHSDTWETLKEADHFRLKPFGYRTRLHQILIRGKDGEGFEQGLERHPARERELALWAARRYKKLHDDKPAPEKVRIVCAFHFVRDGRSVTGRWEKPPLNVYPPSRQLVLSTHNVEP